MAKHTVYIDESLDGDVEQHLEETGKSRSKVVRDALRNHLNDDERGKQ